MKLKLMGITKRWFRNVASIVIVILITLSTVLFLSFRSYYYNTVEMTLDYYSADEIASSFSLYGDSASNGFEAAGRDFIEKFPERDRMSVWIIDKSGNVILTSSGFQIKGEVDMPDYSEAMKNGTGSAKWTGKLPSGEKVMTSSCVYNYSDGTNGGAVRFMISLVAVDEQLLKIALIIAASSLLMFALLMFSGSIFIRSIVNPVQEINETAKRIAGGDLEARIDHYQHKDEIGELSVTVNDMADKLATSDRLKNDFISTISHELRTPLTAIKGWGETLLQLGESDPAMTERGMKVIIGEASRLNDMVEELLDFSRMSSGRLQLNVEKIDILAELDEVLFTFREQAVKKGIELNYNVPSTPAPSNGDAARIKQVFINILDNALKYTEHGGRITVFVEIVEQTTLIISVSDTGAGIPPEDLAHVKEKFYKANTSVRGSGIGLAVADEIMKLHNGTLEIDSILGEGTTVRMTLPIEPTEYDNPEKEGETQTDEQKEE